MLSAPFLAQAAEPAGAALPQANPEAADAAGPAVAQIVVTGSRLTTGFSSPTPVQVLGGDAIKQQAASSLGEMFNRTPAFTLAGPERGGTGTIGPGLVSPNLRNLGTIRTLQLVNGVRTVPTDISGTSDTNVIPTSMVD
ncbi:MAG: TonB-dependent receptor plug domain-containing protein, partial [Alphaproteobacteria bacterium]